MSLQILSDYFLDKLNNLNDSKRYKIQPEIILYLSQVLTANLNSNFYHGGPSEYLFDLYKKSLESSGKLERQNNFRHLGDYSLIRAGYFIDQSRNKINMDYYIEMGSSAYYQVYFISSQDLFYALSKKYQDCVFILNDLASLDRNQSHCIIKIYEGWLENQDAFTKNKLFNLGLIPREVKE